MSARKADRRTCDNSLRPVGMGWPGWLPQRAEGRHPDGLWFVCAACGKAVRSYENEQHLRAFVVHHDPAKVAA